MIPLIPCLLLLTVLLNICAIQFPRFLVVVVVVIVVVVVDVVVEVVVVGVVLVGEVIFVVVVEEGVVDTPFAPDS